MALNITGLSWGGNELIHEKHIDECLAHSTVQMIWVLALSGIAVISGCSFSVFFADIFSLSVSVCLALAFSPPSLCSSWVTSYISLCLTLYESHIHILMICKCVFPSAKWSPHMTICFLPVAYLAFEVKFKHLPSAQALGPDHFLCSFLSCPRSAALSCCL